MATDSGRCPSGRATHERSLKSPPSVGIPSAACGHNDVGCKAGGNYYTELFCRDCGQVLA